MQSLSTQPTVLLERCHVITSAGPERGPMRTWQELGWLEDAAIAVRWDGAQWRTVWLGQRTDRQRPACDRVLDLGGRLLTPGWIDSHTHAVFAGDRSHEFTQRLAGRTYAEIAAAGGGILHTVMATRAATLAQLVASAAVRLAEMVAWGVRVVEIKTGYGLDLATECRTLDAIGVLQQQFAGRLTLVATAMPAHAIAPEFRGDPDGYSAHVCDVILPAMAAAATRPLFCDIFVETGYFSVAQAARIQRTAQALGLRLKAHVDELSAIGGLDWAVAQGAVSVEHLLCTDATGVALLAASDTVAVCLPLTSLFLREPMAPMRALVDTGARVALATDCNPGSAMTSNLPLALQMAVLQGRLTPPEALRAVTRVAALAIAQADGLTGRIAVGERFDATLLNVGHPDALTYQLGAPPRADSLLAEQLFATRTP
jgi:imidazolonepropionase